MFLLIHQALPYDRGAWHVFTFHNVSINTMSAAKEYIKDSVFTFHNVSINTRGLGVPELGGELTLHSTMFLLILFSNADSGYCFALYIPQCFY